MKVFHLFSEAINIVLFSYSFQAKLQAKRGGIAKQLLGTLKLKQLTPLTKFQELSELEQFYTGDYNVPEVG